MFAIIISRVLCAQKMFCHAPGQTVLHCGENVGLGRAATLYPNPGVASINFRPLGLGARSNDTFLTFVSLKMTSCPVLLPIISASNPMTTVGRDVSEVYKHVTDFRVPDLSTRLGLDASFCHRAACSYSGQYIISLCVRELLILLAVAMTPFSRLKRQIPTVLLAMPPFPAPLTVLLYVFAVRCLACASQSTSATRSLSALRPQNSALPFSQCCGCVSLGHLLRGAHRHLNRETRHLFQFYIIVSSRWPYLSYFRPRLLSTTAGVPSASLR